jgi:Bacterial Ig domain
MTQARPCLLRNCLDDLEAREVPSAWWQESFETAAAPALTSGWSSWSNDGQQQFISSRLHAEDGKQALASTGSRTTQARLWRPTSYPADYGASLSVRSDSPAPVELIVRGENLNGTSASYVSAVVSAGGKIELVEVKGGVRTSLGVVRPSSSVLNQWLRIGLKTDGTQVEAVVQRADTGLYLGSNGQWSATASSALKARTTQNPTAGLIGVGRLTGGGGMAYVDNVQVTSPATWNQSFDTTALNALPTSWASWSSDGADRANVQRTPSLSPVQSLGLDGTTSSRGRAWLNNAMPADVSVSSAVYTNTLIPSGVFVRGSNLNSASPNFFSLTASSGPTIQLKKSINGVETTLASLTSKVTIPASWLRLTLTAKGSTLEASVYRTDTQQWLNTNGTWQNAATSALRVADTSLSSGGLVGVDRGKFSSGTVAFDDFEVRPLGGSSAFDATLSASQPGTVFRNSVTLTTSATPATDVVTVQSFLDGTLRNTATTVPASWTLDTTTLANGNHTWDVRIIRTDGSVVTKQFLFSVDNAAPGTPTNPDSSRKYSHIRLAQLAYSANPMGSYELTLAKNSLDLIVSHNTFLNKLETATPDTTKVIYTNVSNLYQGLLTDWLASADKAGVDRESAFYHITTPTAYTGASPSSVPVDRFWNVTQGSKDLTSAARGDGLTFNGEALSLGWTDRFAEVNFDVTSAAKNWQGRLEYVAEVNADGTAKTWKTLGISDTTANLTRDGKFTFDPPKDWKAAKLVATGETLYRVRIITVAGTGPSVKTILGRDYTGAKGGSAGTIPIFDNLADKDGDGYLNATEYANRRSGYDAKFVHESRLFYPYYGAMRFVANPNTAAYKNWVVDYHARQLAANPLADGFFVDNSNGKLPLDGIQVKEAVGTYTTEMAGTVQQLKAAQPKKWIVTNTVGSFAEGNDIAEVSTAVLEEFLLKPNDVNWSSFLDMADLVKQRLATGTTVIIDSHPGTGKTTDERTRMGTLAYYYLLADPDKTMLMFFGGYSPSANWASVFVPAATVDVGKPTGELKELTRGTDPANSSLTYRVYSRDYQNAKVLFKPRSMDPRWNIGTQNDNTATVHQLDGKYRVLKSDGTLGAVVTSVSLRNGEGVVLIRA